MSPSMTVANFTFFLHISKNIRNSLLSREKFIFPGFTFELSNIHISSENGYIVWAYMHKIYANDIILT